MRNNATVNNEMNLSKVNHHRSVHISRGPDLNNRLTSVSRSGISSKENVDTNIIPLSSQKFNHSTKTKEKFEREIKKYQEIMENITLSERGKQVEQLKTFGSALTQNEHLEGLSVKVGSVLKQFDFSNEDDLQNLSLVETDAQLLSENSFDDLLSLGENTKQLRKIVKLLKRHCSITLIANEKMIRQSTENGSNLSEMKKAHAVLKEKMNKLDSILASQADVDIEETTEIKEENEARDFEENYSGPVEFSFNASSIVTNQSKKKRKMERQGHMEDDRKILPVVVRLSDKKEKGKSETMREVKQIDINAKIISRFFLMEDMFLKEKNRGLILENSISSLSKQLEQCENANEGLKSFSMKRDGQLSSILKQKQSSESLVSELQKRICELELRLEEYDSLAEETKVHDEVMRKQMKEMEKRDLEVSALEDLQIVTDKQLKLAEAELVEFKEKEKFLLKSMEIKDRINSKLRIELDSSNTEIDLLREVNQTLKERLETYEMREMHDENMRVTSEAERLITFLHCVEKSRHEYLHVSTDQEESNDTIEILLQKDKREIDNTVKYLEEKNSFMAQTEQELRKEIVYLKNKVDVLYSELSQIDDELLKSKGTCQLFDEKVTCLLENKRLQDVLSCIHVSLTNLEKRETIGHVEEKPEYVDDSITHEKQILTDVNLKEGSSTEKINRLISLDVEQKNFVECKESQEWERESGISKKLVTLTESLELTKEKLGTISHELEETKKWNMNLEEEKLKLQQHLTHVREELHEMHSTNIGLTSELNLIRDNYINTKTSMKKNESVLKYLKMEKSRVEAENGRLISELTEANAKLNSRDSRLGTIRAEIERMTHAKSLEDEKSKNDMEDKNFILRQEIQRAQENVEQVQHKLEQATKNCAQGKDPIFNNVGSSLEDVRSKLKSLV